MRCFLVAGSPQAAPPRGLAPGPGDCVIAADSGARHARRWGWPVSWLVGDLDSLSPDEASALLAAGTPSVVVPAAKDETDLELALARALALGARKIVICAALGGRSDHMLANVLLLTRPDLTGLDVMIAEGAQTMRLLRGGEDLAVAGQPGDLLSLLPVGGDAVGIRTEGLLYPLHDETLLLGQARGMSNVLLGTRARLTLRNGLLLVIHTAGEEMVVQ